MYVSIYLSNYLYIHVQQSKTLYLCIYVCIYVSIKIYLSSNLSISQSIYLSICSYLDRQISEEKVRARGRASEEAR